MEIDQARLEAFIGQFAGDFGAALHASTVVIGDKLGLYRALADVGPADASAVARASVCDERLVQEWLNAQLASGYCSYDPDSGEYWLEPEQVAVLADQSSPAFMAGAMTIAVSTAKDEEKVRAAFLEGKGLGWHEHHHDLFHGTERLFKPGYVANLVSSWIPALDGVEAGLVAGGRIADLGCGHGASSILLASAFPNCTVHGFDYHRGSIDIARKRSSESGVADRVQFDVASADAYPGIDFDLVCTFDALHDMGDPLATARHVRRSLKEGGSWLLVEPMAGERPEDNVNPVGRIFYSASTFICTPAAQAQDGGYALGAQASEQVLSSIMVEAGFSRFHRATETPFNRVFQVQP
ncbi:MAG: class I SAM-dependent methyltransferase [Microthrixaceae bacterium]|nr:class I SAM-dependent methyltransferase [Acidimicrobiales bacterium]MCB9403779.1 class I SAM-dependent methyltransferase [Microthrixaceae bacterium]